MAEFADFELEVDLTETPAMTGEFQLCPPGTYTLEIINIEQKTSKTNNSMIVVTFQVAEDSASNVGMRIWNNYSLLPQAIGRLKNLMVAAGVGLDKFRAGELMGARVIADVVHTKGDPQPDPTTGELREPRVFANVVNERSLEETTTTTTPPPATPPIANKKGGTAAAAKSGNGSSRRA